MREAMSGLVQEIIGSYDARVNGVAQIRKATQVQLQELDRAHQAMARQQRAYLSKGRADLGASVNAQLQELDRAHNDLGASVNAQLQELDRAHQAMARQQRADLSKGRADLGASVNAQLQELDRAHNDLGASVNAQLQELDRAHNAMAGQQRETLTKAHADLNRAETRRKAGVHSWMEEVAATHGAAREEWQNLAATMQAKRAGVVVAEAPPEVAPAPRAGVEVATAAEEEAVEVGEVTEELVSLSARAFAYLANHPDGTRLTELEGEFGLGRFQAARVVRHLMNEGRARKQGLLYFAT